MVSKNIYFILLTPSLCEYDLLELIVNKKNSIVVKKEFFSKLRCNKVI